MNIIQGPLALTCAFFLVGCGKGSSTHEKPSPLSVAEWKTMPVEKKYDTEVLERLKSGDPKFQSEEAWDQFTRTVILPSRKKDKTAKR